MNFKSGFVTILGKANVGKSTVLNAIIGEKVSIVSPKPQTTRNNIIGILNQPDCQIVFIDTPGMHKNSNKLDEFMDKSIAAAKSGADVVLLMLDGSKKITPTDYAFINSFEKSKSAVILVINKIDLTSYEKLYPELAKLSEIKFVKEILPLSGLTKRNVDVLVQFIKKYLPESDIKYFDDTSYTDKSERFLVGEIIREKALWLLQEEIPHGIAIDIAKFTQEEGRTVIDADIVCEKNTHKQIIIGAGGSMLKDIGTRARLDIEKLLGCKVYLNLFVKVKENWRSKDNYLNEFGYNKKKLD